MAVPLTQSWWRAERGPPLTNMTVGTLLDHAVSGNEDRPAVVTSVYADVGLNVHWTYAELQALTNRFTSALQHLGIRQGDRVAIWSPNVPAWIAVEFAVAKLGAILVPINPTFRKNEAAFLLEDSEAACCIFLPEFQSFNIWQELKQIRTRIPTLRLALSLGEPVGDIPSLLTVTPDERRPISLQDFSSRSIAQIQYTSGTTGRPKGALLTHLNLVNNAAQTMHRWRVQESDKWCNPMPFFHTTGCGMMTLGIVAARAIHCPIVWFDADRVLDTIAVERCTYLETVPTTLIALLNRQRDRPRDLSSLRVIGTSGAPVSRSLRDRTAQELGVELRVLYGLTEASPTITCTSPEDPPSTRGATTGRPLPWTEVRFVDAAGTAVPPTTPGELQARGYLIMAGYLNQPEATSDAIDSEGWLRTGDIGIMDEDGYVSIIARLKDVIIRGGENIYPAEVEDLLRQHPDVVDACVVGVPDSFFGEECYAFVVTSNATLDVQALTAHVRQRASRQKVPRYVTIVSELPKTASGKILRYVLREQATHHVRASLGGEQ